MAAKHAPTIPDAGVLKGAAVAVAWVVQPRTASFQEDKDLAPCQSLAILVQNGSAPLVQHALSLRANPNSVDGVGIHPLTYAVAAAGEDGEVARLLLSGKANPDAAIGARHVLDLFSTDDQQRVQGVMELQKSGDAARRVHKGAIEAARREYARRLVDTRWDELQSSSDGVRLSVLAAVAGIGHLAAPLAHDVAPLLGDGNMKIVEAASKVIAQFGSVEDYLNDPNPLTRSAVLKQVVRGRGREASAKYVDHFVKALKDEDFRVRHAGSQALLELGDLASPYAADLAAALGDDDWYVRGNAVQALGKVGNAAVPYVGNIATCLGDSVPEVRRMAKEVLGKVRALSLAAGETGEVMLGRAVEPAARQHFLLQRYKQNSLLPVLHVTSGRISSVLHKWLVS
eukprot:s595_g17.t1